MLSNPRPLLYAGLGISGFFFVVLTVGQVADQSLRTQLATLSAVLFGAFLTGLIGSYLSDYVSERGQLREWWREDNFRVLGPLYEEVLANMRQLESFGMVFTTNWDKVSKERYAVLIPEDLWSKLVQFYHEVVSYNSLRFETVADVKLFFVEAQEVEFGRILGAMDLNYYEPSDDALYQSWPSLMDGDLDHPTDATIANAFNSKYNAMARKARRAGYVPDSLKVLRNVKSATNHHERVQDLKKSTKARRQEADLLLVEMRNMLRRPYAPQRRAGMNGENTFLSRLRRNWLRR